MKVIFQLIGFLVVILLLLTAVLFYLDSKGLLSGDLGSLIHALHQLYLEARDVTLAFLQRSGIADDAADLLDEGFGGRLQRTRPRSLRWQRRNLSTRRCLRRQRYPV